MPVQLLAVLEVGPMLVVDPTGRSHLRVLLEAAVVRCPIPLVLVQMLMQMHRHFRCPMLVLQQLVPQYPTQSAKEPLELEQELTTLVYRQPVQKLPGHRPNRPWRLLLAWQRVIGRLPVNWPLPMEW
jgi:hypothetical protein